MCDGNPDDGDVEFSDTQCYFPGVPMTSLYFS